MSQAKVDAVTDSAGTGPVDFPQGLTGAIVGVTTNSNAAAGEVGEYVEELRSTNLSISSGTTYDMTASPLALTAGDWDVSLLANVSTSTAATIDIGISATSVTFEGVKGIQRSTLTPGAAGDEMLAVPSFRVSLAGSANYYAIVLQTGGGASVVTGRLSARRVR